MKIGHEEIKAAFDEVVPKTIALAKSEIREVKNSGSRESVNAIVLVGGFGSCRYLQKCLRNSGDLQGIPILISPNP
jgi:hypothetical protein